MKLSGRVFAEHNNIVLSFIISSAGDKEVKIGEYNGVTGTLDLSVGEEVKWRAGGKGPPKDRTLTIYEDSHVNVGVYIGLAVAATIGIIIATVFLIVNIRYRDQK